MNEFMEVSENYDFRLKTPDDAMIYHYTSPEALKSIIDNKEIWFSDRIFMNDFSDGNYIKDLILEEKEFIIKKLGLKHIDFEYRLNCTDNAIAHGEYNAYVVSFSIDADNLGLWNYYTKNSGIQGYNIGINVSKLLSSLAYKTEAQKESEDGERVSPLHGKVIYDKEKQLDEIRRMINYFASYIRENNRDKYSNMYINTILNRLTLLGKFFKKKEFEAENEYRIIMIQGIQNPMFTNKELKSKTEFRIKDGYFIPYIPLSFKLDAIKSITISPTVDKELATRGLEQLLSKNKIKSDINYSKIPVRY